MTATIHAACRHVQRGVDEAVDGLKGFPEAIEAVYPEAIVQTNRPHDPQLAWCIGQ